MSNAKVARRGNARPPVTRVDGNTNLFTLKRRQVSAAQAREWETLARMFHDATRCDSIDHSQDAFRLARLCNLLTIKRRMRRRGGAIIEVPKGGLEEGYAGRIWYDGRESRSELHETIAHEVGHFLLRYYSDLRREPPREWKWDSEAAADYIGRAIMLPRSFDRDVDETWNLHELHRRHPNVTYEALALRILERRPAIVTVLDGRGVVLRAASPWLPPSAGPTAVELSAATRAFKTGKSLSKGESVHVYPLVTRRGSRRTIIVRALDTAPVAA